MGHRTRHRTSRWAWAQITRDKTPTAGDDMSTVPLKRSNTKLFAMVAVIVVIADQVTKHWATSSLNDGHVVHVIWTLQFSLAFNSGMAFSQGTNFGPVIGILAMGALVALAFARKIADNFNWSQFGVGSGRSSGECSRSAVEGSRLAARKCG